MKIKSTLLPLLISLTLSTAAHATTWTLTDLGTFGGVSSTALGINNAGQVVGYATATDNTPYPAIWQAGVISKLATRGGAALKVNSKGIAAGNGISTDGLRLNATLYIDEQAIDLGTFGGTFSNVNGINDNAQVIGYARTLDEKDHAFLIDETGIMDLGTFGGQYSYAYGINNSGQVVGSAYNADGISRCFLFNGSNLTDIGTLGGKVCIAWAINDAGQVTGNASTANSGPAHAFIYENGVMRDLGTLGGSASVGLAINQNGQVVGYARTARNDIHAFIYSNGIMTDMGTLGGTTSTAVFVNASGQAVGNSTDAYGVKQAFFYSNGVMINVNTLVPGLSDVDANRVYLNDAGQITGTGTINGKRHGFLLTPKP